MSINKYSICRILIPILTFFTACQDQQQAPVASVGPPGVVQTDAGPRDDLGPDSADLGTTTDLSLPEDMAIVDDAAPDSAQFEVIPFAVDITHHQLRTSVQQAPNVAKHMPTEVVELAAAITLAQNVQDPGTIPMSNW